MPRVLLGLLVLAASGRAEPTFDDLFDAGSFRLVAYTDAAFERLSTRGRLRARGLDPDLYHDPGPAERVPQWRNVRGALIKGFTYPQRLIAKVQAYESLANYADLGRQVALVLKMEEKTPEEFLRAHPHLVSRERRPSRVPGQYAQAVRHSERQFHDWFLAELARRVSSAPEKRREQALLTLRRGLDHADPAVRMRCACVLAEVRAPGLGAMLEREALRRRDPALVDALVRGRTGQVDGALPDALRRFLAHSRPALRLAAVRACDRLYGDWVDDLLRARLPEARGRVRDEITRVLARRAGLPPEPDGRISFYGIRTSSRRVLFVVDVSGSMKLPMDGHGGTREKRIDRTRRELTKTLTTLPNDTLFNVAVFAGRVVPWETRLKKATERQRYRALEFVEAQVPDGGTNVHAALAYALESGADTVYLLTDGEPSVGVLVDPALVLEEFCHRNAHGAVALHTIGLAADQNDELLLNLAARNAGTFVAVR